MARKSRTTPPLPPTTPRAAYTVREFAQAFRISEDMLFKLWKHGKGPRAMRIGMRTLISVEAAEEWRLECERITAHEMGRDDPAEAPTAGAHAGVQQ